MKFRTEIEPIENPGFKIDQQTSIIMVGSCFTDEIGARLARQNFNVEVNSLGTLFNPISIADELSRAIHLQPFTPDELFPHEGRYHTFSRHSRFSQPDPDQMLVDLNADLQRIHQKLATANLLIATFGSAIAFRHIAQNRIVANCHKQHPSLFQREAIPLETIVYRWDLLLDQLHTLNPQLLIILTVSPVRHIGYGLVNDRLSKSTLILACHRLIAEPRHNASYFPSYEILVDDLRDYRFYVDDLVHPSTLAVDHIYDLFRQTLMTPATIALASAADRASRRSSHRPLHP